MPWKRSCWENNGWKLSFSSSTFFRGLYRRYFDCLFVSTKKWKIDLMWWRQHPSKENISSRTTLRPLSLPPSQSYHPGARPKYTWLDVVNASGRAVSQALSQDHPAKHNREQVQQIPKIPGHNLFTDYLGATDTDRFPLGRKELRGVASVLVCTYVLIEKKCIHWRRKKKHCDNHKLCCCCRDPSSRVAGWVWSSSSNYNEALMIVSPWRRSHLKSFHLIKNSFCFWENALILCGVLSCFFF